MTVRELFDRYGPTGLVIGVLALLVVLLPSNAGDGDEGVAAGSPTVDGSGGTSVGRQVGGGGASAYTGPSSDGAAAGVGGAAVGVGAAAGVGGAPARVGGASQGASAGVPAGPEAGSGAGGDAVAGTTVHASPPATPLEGADCRSDGRQPGIAAYMPPCQPLFRGDNGGATARGVEGDKIVVARYVQQADPAVNAALAAAGADDSPEQVKDVFNTLRHFHNHHYETYGREVVFVDVHASGPGDNDAAMRADAIRIAEEVQAFAALTDVASSVLAEELAQRNVVVMRYTSLSRRQYEELPLRIFSRFPTPELYYEHMAEYMGKRLAGRNAIHAGDEENPLQTFNDEQRRFGMIWIEGAGSRVDPYAKGAKQHFDQELAKYGVKLAAHASYSFDLPRQQQQSTSMISKMRAEGVTTLFFFGDPLYPAFLTQEATRQSYFPEWLVAGFLYEDLTFYGRIFDQRQWRHAFGITPMYVFWKNQVLSPGYREYHHMKPGAEKGDEGVGINTYRLDIQRLFIGIQMAGPNLTPDTFARGLLDYPPTGGDPANAVWDFTEVDPNSDKDFTEIWWNPEGTGKDEVDNDGVGTMMKANGGRRYQRGQWPSTDADVFKPETSVYTTDEPAGVPWALPHEDVAPHDHPPVEAGGCRSCP